jgi:LCCL domain
MNAVRLGVLSAVLGWGVSAASAQVDLPPAAEEVLKQIEEEVAEIDKKADAEVKTWRDKTCAELKKLQDIFCKEAKLDEAVAVRDLIRGVRDGVSNALPDPGYINNGEIGKVYYYQVTGVQTGQAIYGTDIYTTGSHLGMAAVHCGLLQPGQRGVVKVTMLGGQANYPASTRHGVTSHAYGSWGTSFKVERVYRIIGRLLPPALPDPGTLTGHRGDVGKTLLFDVTGNPNGSAYGTDVYTDDSTLATAAVHAWALAAGQRGVVKVTVLGGQDSYPASTRNGVTSRSWGNWVGSYRVEVAR